LNVPFAPLQAVWISPFWMDRAEFGVGRLHALAGQLSPSSPLPGTGATCTWNESDDMPVNCVTQQTAQDACSKVGGSLPTSAQWEHAARGRGQGRRFPWGNESPTCCMTNIGNVACSPTGPDPVASHLPNQACGPLGDVARDGMVDMAGNVGEWVSDRGQFDCPAPPGIVFNPVCAAGKEFRGGTWDLGVPNAMPESVGYEANTVGFRCVYSDQP
jgi:formylglycine-generating enzyme required for sulfatase activity